MIALAAHARCGRAAARTVLLIAAALGVLWAGLVLSLSQSSFAALLVGLAVLAALRWSPLAGARRRSPRSRSASRSRCCSPEHAGARHGLDQRRSTSATSGRFDLIKGGAAHGARPAGLGLRLRRLRRATTASASASAPSASAAVSHTIPLTVAAEQGVIGLLAYLALLFCAFRLLFGGAARARVRAGAAADRGVAPRGDGRRVRRARAAHARLRGVPRGPAHVGPAGAGRGPGGPRGLVLPCRAGRASPSEGAPTLERCLHARSQSSLP